MQVRERRSEKRAPSRGGRPRGKDSEARKLTARMKGAKSAEGFVKILNSAVEGPIFNYFHASCAYHRLATWKRSGKLAKAAGGLKFSKLNARVQEMIEEGQLHARELANVLWSFDSLFDEYPNVLVLVPAIVAQVPDKAKDMKPQGLSNVLLAAAKLKDDAPDMLNVVSVIVAQVPDKAKDMKPQDLSNSLLALVLLQDSVPGVSSFLRGGSGSNTGFVGEAASRVVKLLPKLSDLDLFLTPPAVVWACAKMELPHDELLSAVAQRFASRKTISSLRDWGLCAL